MRFQIVDRRRRKCMHLAATFGALIDAEDDMEVVGEVADGSEAVRLAITASPDVW
jgi:DNA-binding NarL/FixJ family response regulator